MSDATPSARITGDKGWESPAEGAHLSAYATASYAAGFARGLLWGWLHLSDDPEARERLRGVTGEFLEGREHDR